MIFKLMDDNLIKRKIGSLKCILFPFFEYKILLKMDTGSDKIKTILGPVRILLNLCMCDPTQSEFWGRVMYITIVTGQCFFIYGAILHANLHYDDILKFSATVTVIAAHSTVSIQV